MPDFDAQLASHETIIRHLTALIVKMDDAIEGINQSLAIVTQLLERAHEEDHRHDH